MFGRMAQVVAEEFSAVGGPGKVSMGGDGFVRGPTDPGTYVVAYCGRHTSRRYPDWSGIPWGTPLKEDKGELWVEMKKGVWEKLSAYSRVSRADVEDQYALLYGTKKVPPTWVFNDFGHKTCFLFKDHNGNRKMDGKERIHGEFLHTTPPDEANTALGLRVSLDESHGCVHLKPVDIDVMDANGYLRRGNRVMIHKYSELTHKFPKAKGAVTKPYEVHFFPGLRRFVVLGQSKF